jgi:Porin PorA
MRRVGLVLAGLGTCLIVFAVLMPVWVSSKVLKFPLNEYATATLTASNVSYFSPTKLTELTGVNMEATYTIKGNAAAGSSSTAVWNQFIYVYDQTNKLPFQTMTRTFAFDRRTAQLIDCCGANVNGNSSIEQTGIVGYVFPIGTKQQTYDVFDTNLNKPVPFTYAGTDTVNGIQAYRFEENVAPVQNGTQVLPGSLVGESQASVVLPQYYEMHLTYWIDPDTGALLNATEHEKLTLHDSQGAQALLLLDANLAMTPASVNGLVALDNTQRSKMTLVTTILPLVTGILGVILLIVGILLSRRREDVEGGASATSPELAAGEPEDADRSAGSATRPSLVPGLDDKPHEAPAESPAAEPEANAAEANASEANAAAPAEADAAQPDAAQADAAEASMAEAAEAPAADSAVAEAPAADAAEAEAEAAQPDAAQAEAAEAPAAAESETAEPEAQADSAGAPATDAPAPESQAAAESPKAEDAPAEAPTAEMSAATSASPDAGAANAPADAPVTTSRRGRRGSHRR